MERIIKLLCIALLFLLSLSTNAQNYSVKGTVIDENKNPLPGANLLIVENGTGTVTDKNGNFEIKKINPGSYRIQVSYVGYQLKEYKIIVKNKNSYLQLELTPKTYEIDSILVSADKIQKQKEEILGKIDFISSKEIESIPVNNVDDVFRTIANVQVNRSWGIFSKNSSVTMRGLEGSARTLILLDGVPMNKSAGGSINWAMLNPDDIEKIEVIKGPASALYGNNAMAGIINIITTTPKEKLAGSISALAGTYNTLGTNFLIQSNLIKNNKGFYWNLSGFYRQGDGYIFEPFEDRDSTSAKLFLNEGSIHLKSGYQFNANNKLELSYAFYEDYRGEGVKVYEKDGKFNSIVNHYATLKYNTKIGKNDIEILTYYQHENYLNNNESLNFYGEYKLNEDQSFKNDIGLWTSISHTINSRNSIIGGIDLKHGDVNSTSTYMTATDILKYKGKLAFSAFFLQYKLSLIPYKLKLQTGFRYDHAIFYNGSLTAINPTSNTGFDNNYFEEFSSNSWFNFSPKASLNYLITENLTTYASVSKGFMPPKLDDLSKSGKIRKGFKIANPELGPEKIITYEIGSKYQSNTLKIEPAIYYSRGYDFQYFVGTGETIETGDDTRPVYKRQNISEIKIKGAEIAIQKIFNSNITINISYAYNLSKIADFKTIDSTSNNISNKYLMEVSPHTLYVGLNYKNRIANIYLSYNFVDEQWADDENTILIDSYSLVNLKIHRTFFNQFNAAIDVQNMLDLEYVDRKGYLSPGRYISVELKYMF